MRRVDDDLFILTNTITAFFSRGHSKLSTIDLKREFWNCSIGKLVQRNFGSFIFEHHRKLCESAKVRGVTTFKLKDIKTISNISKPIWKLRLFQFVINIGKNRKL